jgi:hypothetical protein
MVVPDELVVVLFCFSNGATLERVVMLDRLNFCRIGGEHRLKQAAVSILLYNILVLPPTDGCFRRAHGKIPSS